MPAQPLSDDIARQAVEAWNAHGKNARAAARSLDWNESTFKSRLNVAATRGMMGTAPVLPGYAIKQVSTQVGEGGATEREWIKQTPEPGEAFELPDGHRLKGVSALVDAEGRVVQKWVKTNEQARQVEAAIRAVVDELKQELPRAEPIDPPEHVKGNLLNQYTISDMHLGMLAWSEETGGDDYDLSIAEQLLLDWFGSAIAMSPPADTAVFAQLGDLLHYDSMETVTPTSRHVLDSDSRIQKIIRVAIRVIRQCITMMLRRHRKVRVIMARANHDPVSGAWLREMLAAFYEDEPRVSVDTSADTYYVYEFGKTALFYHHGHKRGTNGRNASKAVDTTFAGKFREVYGRCPHSYGHIGHLHMDEMFESPLMKVERHRTLAPNDSHSAEGGWLSGRDAKVITYHREFGEVSRITISPQMLMTPEGM